jgi:hypothetical protein
VSLAEVGLAKGITARQPAADPHVVHVQPAERLAVLDGHRGGVANRELADLGVSVQGFEPGRLGSCHVR